MKNKLLTEINNVRRIMGLELLMEGPKDDLYQLMKKFSAKETSEIEKNEIESLLKKAGVNDNEIKLLKQGQKDIINSLSGRLVNKLTGEIGQEFEKAFLEKGIPIRALSNLPGGPRLVTTIEDLHTKFMKGEITSETYQKTIKTIKDSLEKTLNRDELERAIRSIEANNEYRVKNPTVADDISRQATMNEFTPGEVLPDRPLDTPSPTPAEDFIKFYGEEELGRAKRWFEGLTEEGIDKLFKDFKDKYARETLSETEKKKIEDFIKTRGKNRVGEFWALQNNWTKGIIIAAILEGSNMVYFLIKMGLPKQVIGLIPIIGPLLLPSDEEKEKEKMGEELSDYVQKVSNYGVYDKKSNEFVVDLETFIESEGTVENQLKSKVVDAIKDYYDLNKDSLNSTFIYDFMDKLSTEKVQPLIDNVKELKDKFTVKGLEDKDPNRPKNVGRKLSDLVTQFREKYDSKYKGTLKLSPEAEKRQKTNYEQPKPNYPTNF